MRTRIIFTHDWRLSGHKSFETELTFYPHICLCFQIEHDLPHERDHWGTRLYVDLFGLVFTASVYDTRHLEEGETGEFDRDS